MGDRATARRGGSVAAISTSTAPVLFVAAPAAAQSDDGEPVGAVDAIIGVGQGWVDALGGPLFMLGIGALAAAVIAGVFFALVTPSARRRSPADAAQSPAPAAAHPAPAYGAGYGASYAPADPPAAAGPAHRPDAATGGGQSYDATASGVATASGDDGRSTAPGGARGSAEGVAYAELEFLAPATLGRVFVTRNITFVGRHSDDHVRIEDITVSRRHALLSRRPDGGFNLRNNTADRPESNPIFVNGVERDNWTLEDGDEVALGGARFRFRALGGRDA